MKKKILSVILFLCLFSCSIYSQERSVSCQIVEIKDSIYIIPNKHYLNERHRLDVYNTGL